MGFSGSKYLRCQPISLCCPHPSISKRTGTDPEEPSDSPAAASVHLGNTHSYSLTRPHRDCGDVTRAEFYLTPWEAALPSSQTWGHTRWVTVQASQQWRKPTLPRHFPLPEDLSGEKAKGVFTRNSIFSSAYSTWNRRPKPNTFLYIHKILKIILSLSS